MYDPSFAHVFRSVYKKEFMNGREGNTLLECRITNRTGIEQSACSLSHVVVTDLCYSRSHLTSFIIRNEFICKKRISWVGKVCFCFLLISLSPEYIVSPEISAHCLFGPHCAEQVGRPRRLGSCSLPVWKRCLLFPAEVSADSAPLPAPTQPAFLLLLQHPPRWPSIHPCSIEGFRNPIDLDFCERRRKKRTAVYNPGEMIAKLYRSLLRSVLSS